MAAKTLTVGTVFPDGVTVAAYPVSNWRQGLALSGAPVGSTAGSASSISGGVVTVSSLSDDAEYALAGDIGGGNYRYLRFDTARAKLVEASSAASFDSLLRSYKTLQTREGLIVAAAAAGTYTLNPFGGGGNLASDNAVGRNVFPLDLADLAVTGRSTKLRLSCLVVTNDIAPAMNFTVGLYPVSAVAGAAASTNLVTLGTVVPGSTVAVNTPAADSQTRSVTADFDPPAAGTFVLAVVTSGIAPANSSTLVEAVLQARQV